MDFIERSPGSELQNCFDFTNRAIEAGHRTREWRVSRFASEIPDGPRGILRLVIVMFSASVDYDIGQLDAAVAEIEKRFPDDIESIRFTLDEDWAHEAALFFRVLLKDRPGAKLDVFDALGSQDVVSLCNHIMTSLRTAVNSTHLQPYFVFRWMSEQANRCDPEWE